MNRLRFIYTQTDWFDDTSADHYANCNSAAATIAYVSSVE